MSKRILILALFLVLALSACQGASPAGSTVTPEPSAVASALPSETASPVPGTPTQVAQATETQPAGPPGCTVVSRQPTPGPTEQSIFPPVSDQDWVEGPADAYVTITEYGDFQ